MRAQEHVLLSSHTTFRIGGPARIFATCESNNDIATALALARERGLSVYPLGEGSNVLAADAGVEKLVLHLTSDTYTFEPAHDYVRVTADAGVHWDTLVQQSVERKLWGFENLAGIPGSVGAAPVQNVGAYGREIGDTLEWVEAYDMDTGTVVRLTKDECMLSYRDSRFKREPNLLITRVSFLLSPSADPKVDYPDLQALVREGRELRTPQQIAQAVRAVRAQKFPDLALYGTAGSFFKNPIIDIAHAQKLSARYPGMPIFPTGDRAKVSLAWILDHVLGLRGFRIGRVHLFERQPLVLVADANATQQDVDTLADVVSQKVFSATNITIEREVRTLL